MLRRLFNGLIKSFPLSRMSNEMKEPLLIVAGCTGTGKSDLGVALAERFNGEIISADSMQIYKGLDIVTNKITDEEARGIPHHLMSFVEPKDEYNVHLFQKDTLRLIDEIRARQRLPIIVGGTAYYIESVMYEDALVELNVDDKEIEQLRATLQQKSAAELHAQLKELDPDAASLVHPNNHFRVMRALEICLLSGEKKTDLKGDQKKLRYPNTLLFVLDADLNVLDERLDKRVVKMDEKGLLEELDDYYKHHRLLFGTHGVRQSIGIKEFQPYLELDDEERASDSGKQLLDKCYSDLKLHTRQYSRTQRKWFRQRFIRRAKLREVPQTLLLDTSKSFFELVVPYAIDRTQEFFDTGSVTDAPSSCRLPLPQEHIVDEDYISKANTVFHCSTCSIDISSQAAYDAHLSGKRHARQQKKQQKKRRRAESDSGDGRSDEVDKKVARVDREADRGSSKSGK